MRRSTDVCRPDHQVTLERRYTHSTEKRALADSFDLFLCDKRARHLWVRETWRAQHLGDLLVP
jgi:hypothetical protein